MPKLLIVSPVSDVAGCGIGFKRAFDAVDNGWTTRHVGNGAEFFDYPTDAEWHRLDVLWDEADAVLVMELPAYVERLPRKPTIVYHTGTRYRRDPARRHREARRIGAMEVAGGLDLCRLGKLPWLPVVADLATIANAERSRRPPGKPLRIAHAPTNRALKSTDVILDVLARLPVEVDLIEGVSWRECLRRKAACDIYVDELTLGYGMNALECWAMGMPVVSGIADPQFRRDALEAWGQLPWADANADTLEAVVGQLIDFAVIRQGYADRGREFAYRYHSPAAVIDRLSTLLVRVRAQFARRARTGLTHGVRYRLAE